MEYCSIKTQNRVVFTLMLLLLLLSIGCALRFSYSFYLTGSHQRLFVDSSDFFLREHHSNGCGEINPSDCHLQFVYWVTGTICWNWIRTRSLCNPKWRMGFSYLPFIACVSEDDSVPEHKCEWSLLSIVDSPIAPTGSSNALDRHSLQNPIVIVLIMFQE